MTVAPEKVLKELSNLWVTLGKGDGQSAAGVLRACSLTLVVFTEQDDDMPALGETIAALMPEHPARAIVIRLLGGGERTLSERVYAQCWMPFGQRRQICCEQVEITASDAALDDLPSVVLPLAAPDLPVILWCRSGRLPAMREFREIAELVDKVIVDSARFEDPRQALRLLADTPRNRALGDLAWTRLTRWREMLAQVFENRKHVEKLREIRKIRVGYPRRLETSAWYLAAWVRNAFADAHVNPELEMAAAPTMTVALDGGDFQVKLSREEDRLTVTVDGLTNCTNLSPPSDYLEMREELGIVRHDPVFERTLAYAAQLASEEGKG